MSLGRRVSWVIWAVTIVLLGAGLTLAVRNGSLSEDPAFAALAIVMMVGYVSIGALVASRVPKSPIGWLLMTTGTGFLLAVCSSDYAIYALYTNPGALPFASIAVWLQAWIFLVPVGAVVLLVALFPTGSPASPRWRWLPPAIVVDFALGIVTSALRAGPVDISDTPGHPDRCSTRSASRHCRRCSNRSNGSSVWPGSPSRPWPSCPSSCGIARRVGEERQQIRWLAYVGSPGGRPAAADDRDLVRAGGGGVHPAQRRAVLRLLHDVRHRIPAAAAIAVLRYRLWDLDVIVKKTIVASVLVFFLTIASLAGPAHRRRGRGRPARRRAGHRPVAGVGHRRPGLAAAAAVAPDRRPSGLRRAGDAVRGAHRVLRTDGETPTRPTTSCRGWRRSSAPGPAPRPSRLAASSASELRPAATWSDRPDATGLPPTRAGPRAPRSRSSPGTCSWSGTRASSSARSRRRCRRTTR